MAGPVVVLEVAFASQPLAATQVWTDVTAYVDLGQPVTVDHGRQDEFGEVQPGKFSCSLKNDDGRFTPGRAASPYSPNVKIGRQVRYGLMVPGGGKQLVESDPSFEAGTNGALASGFFGGPTPVIGVSALHPAAGAQGIVITWGTAGQGMAQWTVRGLMVGSTYTASFRAFVPVGSPDVSLGIAGITFGSTVATKGSLFDLTTTFVATANTHLVQVIGQSPGAVVGTQCFLDAMQVELGSARTTFTATAGVFGWRFTGFVDSYGHSWLGGPAVAARVVLRASDKLRRLGVLTAYRSAGEEDVLACFPMAYYTLDEPATATKASDSSGRGQPELALRQIGGGNGKVTFAEGKSPGYDGATATWFHPAATADGFSLYATLDTRTSSTGASLSVVAAPSGAPTVSLVNAPIALLQDKAGSWLRIYTKATTGALAASYFDARTGVTLEAAAAFPIQAGNQQLTAVIDLSAANTHRLSFYFNGAIVTSVTQASAPATLPPLRTLEIGGGKAQGSGVFDGVLSHAAVYDTALSALQVFVQNFALFSSSTDFTASAWVVKLLAYRGDTNATTEGSTGNDALGPQMMSGRAPIEALREVAATVGGVFYTSTAGANVLQLRDYRYNRAVTLTLDGSAGQIEPDLILPGDDTLMANDVTATSAVGLAYRSTDTASQAEYGIYTDSVSGVFKRTADAQAAAQGRVGGYGAPRLRVPNLTVHLLHQPTIAATVVSAVEIGRRVRVTNMPTQSPTSTLDLFVEGWTEVLSVEDWQVTFNTSPADTSDYWIVGDATYGVVGTTDRVAW